MILFIVMRNKISMTIAKIINALISMFPPISIREPLLLLHIQSAPLLMNKRRTGNGKMTGDIEREYDIHRRTITR